MSVLREVIANLVQESTGPQEPPKESAAELLKYLQDPKTVDLVYTTVLERAALDRSSNAEILGRCVKFLRTHLAQNMPSPDILVQLDNLCQDTVDSLRNESVVKSAAFLRTVIARHYQADTELEADEEVEQETTVKAPEQTNSRPPVIGIVTNFLEVRTRSPALAPISTKSPWPLLHCELFGGHFQKKASSTGRFEIVDDDVIRMTDVQQMQHKIQTVSKAKKSEETKVYKESGQVPKHAKAPQLFVYKFYCEQTPLDLPTERLSVVTNTVVGSNSQSPEDRVMASKVFIKILIDQYCSGDETAINEVLALFFEILEGPTDSKIHAFNLLFNLAIHINLIAEHIPRLDTTDLGSDSSGHVHIGPSKEQLEINLMQIETMLADLFGKLSEMLLWLVHRRVSDAAVWQNALNCFIFFVSGNGKVDKTKMKEVDVRVFHNFLTRIPDMSDTLRRHVIVMLLNFLYEDSDCPLNLRMLDDIGGIDFIIDLYEHTRSTEAQENLFIVLFDYAVAHIGDGNKRVTTDDADVVLILQVLCRMGAPYLFQNIFRYCPTGFVDSISRFIYFDGLKRDPVLLPLVDSINKSLLLALLYEWEKLARACVRLEQDFVPLVQAIKATGDLDKNAAAALKGLISSDSEYERRQGTIWVFDLLQTYVLDDPVRLLETPIGRNVDNLLNSMVAQRTERRVYLHVCQKIIQFRKFKLGINWNEHDFTVLANTINEKLTRLVTVQEKDENNLLLMFDIIFNFVTIDFANDPGTSPADLTYDRFLQSVSVVSYELLKHINISLCHHLFTYLTKPQHNNIRALLLIFMIEQCRSKILLESIGGMNFFRSLLGSRDPQIAYHASRYIVDQIKAEKPDQFRTLLAGLIAKAQQTNDERIIENPYYLLRSVFEKKA